ncbi:hypothetical protein [uncultured Shimia sp.]|uniref:hypothetical protein n=1 Tax=uncultured Shimia sp. TaxID=573152 RepID=UPI002623EA54|nr:hypothetical protein [uncultured Shimia sp.]
MFEEIFAIELAIAVAVGVLSAVVTLGVFHKLVSPKIIFSDKINVVKHKHSERSHYTTKVQKKGVIDLIETTAICRVSVFNIAKSDSSKSDSRRWNYYTIPTTFSNSLRFGKGHRYIQLKVHESSLFDPQKSPTIHKNTSILRPERGLRLEDVFMSYEKVHVRLYILGHDRFTGIKKLYVSKPYKFWQIRTGDWMYKKLELVERPATHLA